VVLPHPFIPSPTRITGKKPQILIAGEGSLGERGLRPLSYSLPLFDQYIYSSSSILQVGEGV